MRNITIDNMQDILDSRDIIARVEELRDMEERDDSEVAELSQLETFCADAEGYSDDWHHGATLIRDSYFQDYAMELAEDIGAIDRNASWPNNCIDWDQATRELQQDYTAVAFDGITYWTR